MKTSLHLDADQRSRERAVVGHNPWLRRGFPVSPPLVEPAVETADAGSLVGDHQRPDRDRVMERDVDLQVGQRQTQDLMRDPQVG